MKLHVLVVCLMGVLGEAAAQTQDPRLGQQALHCAAVIGALAQGSGVQAEAAQRWQRAADLLLEAARQADATGGPALQSAIQRQAQQKRQDQPSAYREDVVVCGAWAEGFLGQGAQVRYVPVYPKIIAPAVRAQYEAAARTWLTEAGH